MDVKDKIKLAIMFIWGFVFSLCLRTTVISFSTFDLDTVTIGNFFYHIINWVTTIASIAILVSVCGKFVINLFENGDKK